MSGIGWHGFATGASIAEAQSVQHAYTSVFQSVQELIRSDFGLTTPSPARLFVVHVKDPINVDPVTELMMGGTRRPHEDVWGRYISGVKALVISGVPDCIDFRWVAAHETCHAICEAALGAVGEVPWSSEGYAEFVSLRVASSQSVGRPDRRHITTVRAFRKAAMDLSLRRVLGFEDLSTSIPSHYVGCFQSHAALFLSFLYDRGVEDALIRKCFRAAVKEDPPSCKHHLLALEEAFGKSIEDIEKEFDKFCSQQ